jgi:hypothetical protein
VSCACKRKRESDTANCAPPFIQKSEAGKQLIPAVSRLLLAGTVEHDDVFGESNAATKCKYLRLIFSSLSWNQRLKRRLKMEYIICLRRGWFLRSLPDVMTTSSRAKAMRFSEDAAHKCCRQLREQNGFRSAVVVEAPQS